MSALDELKSKKTPPTELELCILMAGALESPEQAAAELAALRERVERLEKIRKRAEIVIEGWELFGNVSMADMDKLRAHLREE